MNIDDFSFHDTEILEVRESTSNQTIDFLLEFPTDWENNISEKRILSFKDVIYYLVDEIPFTGSPTILKIVNLGQKIKAFGIGRNQLETVRNMIEIQTNSGNRIIHFSDCEFIKP